MERGRSQLGLQSRDSGSFQKIKDDLQQRGHSFLSRYQTGHSTADVAASLGAALHISGVPPVQTLRPYEVQQSTQNVYSGNYGLGAFPLHTDLAHWYLPPRYFVLRCLAPAAGTYTSIVSCSVLRELLGSEVVCRALFSPRKKMAGKSSLLRLMQKDGQDELLRWDVLFLRPANVEAQSAVTTVAECQEFFDVKRIEFHDIGDTLIVDNWSILHGRSSVPEEARARHLERVYFKEIRI